MEIQTTVLQFIANQNHNSSNRSSCTSHVNNNTRKDTQPILESQNLKQQQQQQYQTEKRFSEGESFPWESVTTKQRNNQNQSTEKTKLFVGNLNESTTEKDLNELFGLESTSYLREMCRIEMPKNKRAG